MANIILTSYCNLHCPYCFADTMIKTEDIKNISIEQFKKTLNWLADEEKIGLIGGEPTLHPQFQEILKVVNDYSTNRESPCQFVLFTNGIYLHKYLNYIPQNMSILINLNQPQAMTTTQYSDMINNIIRHYKVTKDDVLYIGDTNVDEETARNGEVDYALVTYGYRTIEEIKNSCVTTNLIDTPDELLKYIRRNI